jgi:hypothetical protein
MPVRKKARVSKVAEVAEVTKVAEVAESTESFRPILHTHLTLIEVADPLLLEELRADRRFGPLIVAQLSDRVAAVKPNDSERLLKQLLKAGHTPKVIES